MIIIGDIEYNPDSHTMVHKVDETLYAKSFSNRILLIDIDYLGLTKEQIQDVVDHCKRPFIMCTLFPDKIDLKRIHHEVKYRKDAITKKDKSLRDIAHLILNEPNRPRVLLELMVTKPAPYGIMMYLMSNTTKDSFGVINLLDRYTLGSDRIFYSLVAYLIKPGSVRVQYKFRKVTK